MSIAAMDLTELRGSLHMPEEGGEPPSAAWKIIALDYKHQYQSVDVSGNAPRAINLIMLSGQKVSDHQIPAPQGESRKTHISRVFE